MIGCLGTLVIMAGCCRANQESRDDLLVLKEQGSFTVGGNVIQEEGTYDATQLDNFKPYPAGQTFHGDHAYVFYQVPNDARPLPLVFLHGAGQSAKTWETTPDGREGFQNLFLRRGFSTYLVDQPRRGKAGRSTVETTIKPIADEQMWFDIFRLLLCDTDAEDVAQDVFIKIYNRPEIWKNKEFNSKYLFTMTKNHVFNLIKRRNFERNYHENLYEKHDPLSEFGLEDNLHAKELKLMALHAIEQMPNQRRRIFKMSRFEGLSNADIAMELELSVRTVERHIYLALSELKKVLLVVALLITSLI